MGYSFRAAVIIAVVSCFLGYSVGWASRGDAWSRGSTLTAEDIGHIHPSGQPVIPRNEGWAPGTLVSTAFRSSHLGTMVARGTADGGWVEVTCEPSNWVPFTFWEPGGRWSLRCERPSWLLEDGGAYRP